MTTWCRMYHPELNQHATIADTAVEIHRYRGWQRVGRYVDDPDTAVPEFDELVDLDAAADPTPLGATKPQPESPAKTITKEQQ